MKQTERTKLNSYPTQSLLIINALHTMWSPWSRYNIEGSSSKNIDGSNWGSEKLELIRKDREFFCLLAREKKLSQVILQ